METIAQMFAGKVFTIPDYQREYAWEVKHCQDLINDIESLELRMDHYLGSMTLLTRNDNITDQAANIYRMYEVVDGQQRLTTIMLLLTALLSRIRNTQPLIANGIAQYLRCARLGDQNNPYFYRVQLNTFCADYFQSGIVNRAINGQVIAGENFARTSHKRLFDAYNYFSLYFRNEYNELPQYSDPKLIAFYTKTTQHLRLSGEVVNSALDAAVIFETMNNRGKPISELDKIKNRVLYLASKLNPLDDTLPTSVENCWKNTLDWLMSAGLSDTIHEDNLLRYHWAYYVNPSLREWSGIDSFKARFDFKSADTVERRKTLYTELVSYVNSLSAAARAYCDVLRPAHAAAFEGYLGNSVLDGQVREWGDRFQRVRTVANFYPLLMAARLKLEPDQYLQVLKLCERIAFRTYVIVEKRLNKGRARLYQIAYALFSQEEVLFDQFLNELSIVGHQCCTDDEFRSAIMNNNRDWYASKGLLYLLTEYERSLNQNDEAAALDFVNINERTIEHILPQTLEDIYWSGRFTRRSHRNHVNRLGNLTLAGQDEQTAFSNKGFDVKRGTPAGADLCYANSNFNMTRDLYQYSEWTRTTINERTQLLAKWAIDRWSLPELDQEVYEQDEEPDEEERDEFGEE